MRPLLSLLLLLFYYCPAYTQARYKIKSQKFDSKPIVVEDNKDNDSKIDPKNRFNLNDKGNEVDEFFYLKWAADKKLNFDDFRYDKAYFKQLISEKDTDLLRSVYPNYQAFYNMLNKRMAQDSMGVADSRQRDSLNKKLNAKLNSFYTGNVYSASVDRNISFEKNIDSPAASVLTISPAIYAVNDTMFYYNIVALFSKYESWMVVKSKDILAHEQIHFDIFELYARKLRKYWAQLLRRNTPGWSIYEITGELAPVYEQLYQQLYNVQAIFDEQTAQLTAANAPLTDLNTEWQKNIAGQLDSLKDYANPEGTIILK